MKKINQVILLRQSQRINTSICQQDNVVNPHEVSSQDVYIPIESNTPQSWRGELPVLRGQLVENWLQRAERYFCINSFYLEIDDDRYHFIWRVTH